MIVVRGVNLYPSAVEAAVRQVPGIDEYRVNIGHRGQLLEIELQIESADESAVTNRPRPHPPTLRTKSPSLGQRTVGTILSLSTAH
jgi:phenylacetate-CoA ligase